MQKQLTQQTHAQTIDEEESGSDCGAAARETAGKIAAAYEGVIAPMMSNDPAKYLKSNTQKGGQ